MRVAYTFSAATCLALAAALPNPQRDDGNENDQALLDMSGWPDSVLENVNKPCTDPLASDADQDPEEIWNGLGCGELRSALHGNWSAESETTKLSYVEYETSLCYIIFSVFQNP